MSLQVLKSKDRFCSKKFLDFIRAKPCCICGAPSTASHMESVKWSTGSDALAVPACMINGHHVQSTRTSKRILELNGIDIKYLHWKLWNEFIEEQGDSIRVFTQSEFEGYLRERGFTEPAYSRRKNRK